MKFFIKIWPDDTVTLMTESGRVVSIHDGIEDAIAECASESAYVPGQHPAFTATTADPAIAIAC